VQGVIVMWPWHNIVFRDKTCHDEVSSRREHSTGSLSPDSGSVHEESDACSV
jgi:hypothetical protein